MTSYKAWLAAILGAADLAGQRGFAVRIVAPLGFAMLSLAPNPAVAGEIPEAELLRRTTLDPVQLNARKAEVDAMTPEKQGEAMVAAVKNRTIIYYQYGHGVYVEYTSADNAIFMWYPRNR